MNNVKFANFPTLFGIDGLTLMKENNYSLIFAGMYSLTVLVKDGFAGLKDLHEEAEKDFVAKIRREIRKTLNKQNEK